MRWVSCVVLVSGEAFLLRDSLHSRSLQAQACGLFLISLESPHGTRTSHVPRFSALTR